MSPNGLMELTPPASPAESVMEGVKLTRNDPKSAKKPTFDSLVQLAKTELKAKASPTINGARSFSSESAAVNGVASRVSSHSSIANAKVNWKQERTKNVLNLLAQHSHDEKFKPCSGGLLPEDIARLEVGLTEPTVAVESAAVKEELDLDALAQLHGLDITERTEEESPLVSSTVRPLQIDLAPLSSSLIKFASDPISVVPAGIETERDGVPPRHLHNTSDERKSIEDELLSLNTMIVSVAKQHETAIQDLMATIKKGSSLNLVARPVKRPDESKFIKILADRDEEIADLQSKLERLTTQCTAPHQVDEATTQTEANSNDRQGDEDKELAALRRQLEVAQAEIEKKHQELKKQRDDLTATKTANVHLSEQLRTLAKYEERSKKDQSQASRLVNANQQLQRMVDKQSRALERLTNQDALLRGACYLVRAGNNVLLNKRTLACINCYATNRICDNKSPDCDNCQSADVECRRFRCAKVHVYGKKCPDGGLCPLRHTGDGWLVTDNERPEW